MSTTTLSGAKYFATFIDDYSKKTWIYFLKTKDEVFNQFKDFKASVENSTGKKIKKLRSDNGENISIKTSQISVHRKASRENGQLLTIQNKMELQNGRIGP